MAIDESHGLVFQLPVVIVLITKVCGKTYSTGVALESQRTTMNANSNDAVVISLLQLLYHLCAQRTVDAHLTSEVLQQNVAQGRGGSAVSLYRVLLCWLHVDKTFIVIDMVAGRCCETNESEKEYLNLHLLPFYFYPFTF